MLATAIDFTPLADVAPGDELRLKFRPHATGDTIYLVLLANAGIVRLGVGDRLVLEAIQQSGSWGGDRNRTLTVLAGPEWDGTIFMNRMEEPLEALSVTFHHPLVDLSVLDGPATELRLRFAPDGLDAVGEVLELVDAGLIELPEEGTQANLERAFSMGDWGQREVLLHLAATSSADLEMARPMLREIAESLEMLRTVRPT